MDWNVLNLIVGIVLSLLICPNSAFSAVNWSKYSYFSNSGGLNDNLQATEIDDKEATDIQNIIFDTGGAIKKRYGYTNIPPTPTKVATGSVGAITGLIQFNKDNGNKYLVGIVNANGKATAFKKTFSSGSLPSGAWDNIDYASLPSTYTDNQLPTMVVASDSVIMAFPSATPSKPFMWTGTGNVINLTASATCPVSSIVAYHMNSLFLSGDTSNPSRVSFSSNTNITNYTATDFFDVNTSDGTIVRALLPAYGSLYIFKDKSIWQLTGYDRDSYILQKMVEGIGTTSPQSIKVVNNFIYFTTSQGDIAVYDGNYTVKFISQKIRNTIGGLNQNRSTNMLGLAYSTYKYVDADYYVSASTMGNSTNNQILLFDTAHQAWTKFKGMNINAWTVGDTSTGQYAVYFGDYDGYVYKYPSTGYYDGEVSSSAIEAFYQTKWFRYPESSLGDKYLRVLKTYTLSEDSPSYLTIISKKDYQQEGNNYIVNLSQSGSKWDTAIWDVDLWSGTSLIVDREEPNQGVSMFQFKFENDNVDQGFSILGFESFIEPVDRI